MIATSAIQGGLYFSLFYLMSVLITALSFLLIIRKKKRSVITYLLSLLSAILFLLIGTKLFTYSSDDWNYVWQHHVFPYTDHKTVLGGIMGGMFGLILAKKWFGIKESLLDYFAVLLPIGMAIQRFGCLFAGCCFGNPTALPWGITYGKDSFAYREQLQGGLISNDAITSMSVHPDQIYHIIFCSIIALIVWKKSSLLKAKGNKFLFSVSLYLLFRFFEEFTRFVADQMHSNLDGGLKQVQWILLACVGLLALAIFVREKLSRQHSSDTPSHFPLYKNVFLLSIFLVLMLKAGDWFVLIERIILWVIALPLLIMIGWKLICYFILSGRYRIAFSLCILAMVLMSQTYIYAPKDSLSSYFSMTVSAFTGNFYNFHEKLKTIQTPWYYPASSCNGNSQVLGGYTTTNLPRERFSHNYTGGSVGIHYVEYFTPFNRMNVGLSAGLGNDIEQSVDNSFKPIKERLIYNLNPSLQFDFRWIGLGGGFHLGSIGYDLDNTVEARTLAGSYNIRLGPYDLLFFEFARAEALSGFGENVDEFSFGTGFGKKNMSFKFGTADGELYARFLFPVSDNWMMEPYFRFGEDQPEADYINDHVSGSAYRLSFKYLFAKKHKKYWRY